MQKYGKNQTFGNETIKKMRTPAFACAHFFYFCYAPFSTGGLVSGRMEHHILRYTLGVTPYFFLNTRIK